MIETYDQEFQIHDGSGRPGDCLRASLATMYGLHPRLVPHFAEFDSWEDGVTAWRGGLSVQAVRDGRDWLDLARTVAGNEHHLFIAIGPSPRGTRHAVVYTTVTGEMVHDPHPSRAGLTGTPDSILVRCW